MDSKNSQTFPATTSTTPTRQLPGTADAQTAHHAATSTAPAHQPLDPVKKQPPDGMSHGGGGGLCLLLFSHRQRPPSALGVRDIGTESGQGRRAAVVRVAEGHVRCRDERCVAASDPATRRCAAGMCGPSGLDARAQRRVGVRGGPCAHAPCRQMESW